MEQTPPCQRLEQRREDGEVVYTCIQQMRRGTGPQLYGGWPEIVIFAHLEGVHIGVYTRDKTARKSLLYKVWEVGLPTATKKAMLEGGETMSGQPHFWNILPPGVVLQLRWAPNWRKVVRKGTGRLENKLPEMTTICDTKLYGLCLFHALVRVWNEMDPQVTRQTGQRMKDGLLEMREGTPGEVVEGYTLA